MSNKDINKDFISTAKKLLEDKGYEVKTSHLYDIFSKLSGYKDWHQASVKDVKLANSIKKYIDADPKISPSKNYLDFIRDSFGNLNEEKPFNLHNPQSPAWNHSISGQTGSGKSSLASKMIASSLKKASVEGEKILINILEMGTSGRSYQKIVSLAGGKQIALSRKNKPNIQIFELIPELSLPTKAKIQDVALKLMAKNSSLIDIGSVEQRVSSYYNDIINFYPSPYLGENIKKHFQKYLEVPYNSEYLDFLILKPGEMLPSSRKLNCILALFDIFLSSNSDKSDGFQYYDKDEITEIILDTYKKIGKEQKRFPTMTDLVENTKTIVNSDPNAIRLINKLSNWTQLGDFSMFDNPTNLDLSSDINRVNIAGLESEKTLYMAYGIILSYLLYEKLEINHDCLKISMVEDSYELFTNVNYQEFFIDSLRRSRANAIATISISQNLEDYFYHDYNMGRAIVSSFNFNLIGKPVNGDASQRIASFLRLDFESMSQLSKLGLHQETSIGSSLLSTYSNFLINHENETIMLKNILTPFEKVLYSTSFIDNTIIDYYLNDVKKFDNLLEVLLFISENKHLGDPELIKHLENSGYKVNI